MPEGDITSESLIPADGRLRSRLPGQGGRRPGRPGRSPAASSRRSTRPSSSPRSSRTAPLSKSPISWPASKGPTIALLKGERTALNFLQRLSGIATATRRFVDAVAGTKAKILDTRKTTPGLRLLEKYAVKMGGGTNHRLSLSDMVLIKDNHLRHVGSVAEAVRRARAAAKPGIRIEVEAADLAQVRDALAAGADMIMLDNMLLETMREAVTLAAGRVPLEASGNDQPRPRPGRRRDGGRFHLRRRPDPFGPGRRHQPGVPELRRP